MDEIVLDALVALVDEAAKTGERWHRTIRRGDWRVGLPDELRPLDLRLLPSQDIWSMRQKLKGTITKGDSANLAYFILRPLAPADRDRWVPVFGFEMRVNRDGAMQYCYHVVFFGMSQNTLQSFGHRFEGPEGKATTHNYYHVQPLKSLRNGALIPGALQVQPDKFPTFPLHGHDPLDLALHAIHIASGPEFINQLCTEKLNPELTTRAIALTNLLHL